MSKIAVGVSGDAAVGRHVFRIVVGLWASITIAFLVVLTFVDGFFWPFLALLYGPTLLVLWLSVPVSAVVVLILRLRRRDYRATVFPALVPIIAFFMFYDGLHLGASMRFLAERPAYAARIEAARAGHDDPDIFTSPSIVAFFPWSGSAVGSYGVVYDELDVIAKPLARRQELWRYRGIPGELLCNGEVKPLGGHFYIAGFGC